MNKWDQLKDFLNNYEVGALITRTELLMYFQAPHGYETIETYRSYLSRAGYLDSSYENKLFIIK